MLAILNITGMLVFNLSELSLGELSVGSLMVLSLDCCNLSSRSATSYGSRQSICGSASCGRWGFRTYGQSLR